ncbi:MAG: hypothetical protein IT319_06805 [Anaerolineae bacterium]|nr:hypothetical protein [Anaerolineae bacterium]
METIFTIFIILHGLVHLLYVGQSQKLFELQPQLTWPDGSWAFSGLLGDPTTRLLASIVCVLAAVGFVGGGIGILASQAWWRPLVVGAAILSAVGYLLLWNGRMQKIDAQGGIGILINVGILVVVLMLQQPRFEF